jgi:hypothetical protein
MTWTGPPRMEDMAELSKVALDEPIETRLRLERLRRELGDVIEEDPIRVANTLLGMAHVNAMQDRQLRHALLLLAQRQDVVEGLKAHVVQLEKRLMRIDPQHWRRPWWRWW